MSEAITITKSGPVLLLGLGGMLWRAWDQLLETRGVERVSPSLDHLDLTRPSTIEQQLTSRFKLVINCAAWTDVDGAETNPSMAMAINGEGVGVLARRCAEVGAVLVHYSTDYIFNGRGTTPWRVDHPIEPLNVYGQTKARGEELIRQSGCKYLLVRTSWLYAPWGKNFVRTIADRARRNLPTTVVDDQRGRPTSAEHLVATCVRLLEHGARGTFHVTDGGECSWHEFASEIVRQVNPQMPVQPCATSHFPRPARRPAYSVLDLSATERLLGPMPPWQTNLTDVLSRLEPVESIS